MIFANDVRIGMTSVEIIEAEYRTRKASKELEQFHWRLLRATGNDAQLTDQQRFEVMGDIIRLIYDDIGLLDELTEFVIANLRTRSGTEPPRECRRLS
jgi:hypothetical protein